RQDPEGAYAAVIPLWFKAMLSGSAVYINGDGETSRDFRQGDVRHSLADITGARKHLDYHPQWTVARGLHTATRWYAKPVQ
ncbi:MAG: hypothetical protein ABR534_15055, partial [Desulfotignum sp.]